MTKMIVKLINPWSRKVIHRDVTNLTEEQLELFTRLMNGELCDRLHDELAPCSPGMFLKAWADEVGPNEAGRVILL